MIEDIHYKFQLKHKKIVATVSDNGSNFVKPFKEFSTVDIAQNKTKNDEGSDYSEEEDSSQNTAHYCFG